MPTKTQEDQQEGLLDEAVNAGKKSLSAGIGAVVGAVAGSVIPGLGTLFGAIVGGVIGRAAESAVNYVFGNHEKKQPAATKQATPETVVSNRAGTNTAQMTAQLGGIGSKASIAAQFEAVDAPVATPVASTSKQFDALFAAADTKTAAPAQGPKSPFATPRLTMGGAAAAA